jgi:hypothetical protein
MRRIILNNSPTLTNCPSSPTLYFAKTGEVEE